MSDRVARLEAAFREIASSRMDGLGLLHPGLQVAAVGFEACSLPGLPNGPVGGALLGVLVSPWFMNLVLLPSQDVTHAHPRPADGTSHHRWAEPRERVVRCLAGHRIDFLGSEENGIGRFEVCSLFSPMEAFADQAAAVATAREVLILLRAQKPPACVPDAPARRRFLIGRPASAASSGAGV